MQRSVTLVALVFLVNVLLAPNQTSARNPIRRAFFNVYPAAEGSRLDDLPSNSGHCGGLSLRLRRQRSAQSVRSLR